MASRIYREYIKVDPNFIPVFSRSSDAVFPDKWQSFYPHDSFKKILKDVVETLEKGSEVKDRSVWMSGAYGTGKTYASFVIKHILEDSIESITPYFLQNGMETLLARIKGLRAKGRILVVHRSASSGINTQDKLFNAIVESVRRAVKDAGLSYVGADSLCDKVLTILKNPDTSAFNFQGAFNKYRGKFTEYGSVESVIRDLEELDLEDKLEVLNTIIEVAALEGFNWSMSAEEIIDWLEDVRKGNDLHAIFFIWDEFTEYFKNNQNNITGLQEIAQASSRISCYLFLITHSSADQLIHDNVSKKILEARFKLDTIELEESTAFKLLGQAIGHEPDLAGEWQKISDQLWYGIKRGSVDVIKNKDRSVNDEDFRNLLPMHPYATYLLKFIAKDISSNQRTIFQFLSGDYSENEAQTNFRWFIDHFAFEHDGWNYLTVDFLWDYFFRATNVDLDDSFIQTITHYNNFAPSLDDPADEHLGERRRKVLKVTLLLAALQSKNGADFRTGPISLMRPTLENIKACFAGTPQEAMVEADLEYLKSKGVVGSTESANETLYVMVSTAIDSERMEEIEGEMRKSIPFEKLIRETNYKVADRFMPEGFLKHRMNVEKVSPANAKAEAEKVKTSENHIPVFFLFAKNEAEQGKIKEAVAAIFSKAGNRCIVVDFSELPFTDALYEKYIKSKARETYFSTMSNQRSQFDLAKQTTSGIIEDWSRKLFSTSMRVYSAPDKSVQRMNVAELRKEFAEINSSFYGSGLEEITQNDKLFAETGFKGTIAQMAMGKIPVPANFSYVKNLSEKLVKDGIWNSPKYWESQPAHPVSKMKRLINEIMDRDFDSSGMVSIETIWNELKKPPFGLLPNIGSVFLLGFLLSEYANGTYYKRDSNNNTVALYHEGLAELIYGTVKGLQNAKGQFIVKRTPEQIEFCQVTGEIFKIAQDKRNSVDDIAKNINNYLSQNKYPMWTMRYFIDEELHEHEYREELMRLTDLYCEFIKPESKIGRERSKIVEEIYNLYQQNKGISEVYGDILGPGSLRSGMNYHIAQYKPELIQVAGNLNIDSKEYLEQLNAKMSNDSYYLWEISDTNKQIDSLYIDLKLINEINRVLTTKQKTYANARRALIEKLDRVKMPYALLKEIRPDIIVIVDQFYKIIENRDSNNMSFDKEEASSTISRLSNDFIDFFNNQYEDFCKAVDMALKATVSRDEYELLFNSVPSGILFDTTDNFVTSMQGILDSARKKKTIRRLFDTWEEETNSKSPAEWSQTNGIPILCLFTDDILMAQKTFDALNGTTKLPVENDIEKAIEFLKSGRLDILRNREECEKKFIEFFSGQYAYFITSASELRDQVRSVAGENVYDWYARQDVCKERIRKYAAERYQEKYCFQAKEKIKELTAEQAQSYLESLIENDPLLGISILKG